MICPICGFDMKEETVCEKCGFEETKVDFEALENIKVDFDDVETAEDVEEKVSVEDEDLEIDFEQIDQKTVENKPKKSNFWGVSIVSFLAGVLATLIVVGSLNGTIISYFDKVTIGTPYETVESFCDFYFQDNPTVEGMVESFSPYLRSQIVSELAQYGFDTEVDLNADVTDDEKFKDVAKFYLDLVNDSNEQTTKITSIEYEDVQYYKSGSDEFNTYLEEYKNVEPTAEGVSLFANVSFTIKFDVTTVAEETTTVPASTKKNKKNNKTETTTPTTTSAPKTETESMIYKCSVICVKINDGWCVYNGLQVLS